MPTLLINDQIVRMFTLEKYTLGVSTDGYAYVNDHYMVVRI